MPHRIHVFGASGSGTTTLGLALSEAPGGLFLDTDRFYWKKTDPPFLEKHAPTNRIRMIERRIAGHESWVLSGSICSWGDPLLHHFTLAVFLYLDPEIRIARLAERERNRYGDRIAPGGDMHRQHLEFMAWAASYDTAREPVRSLDLHEAWMKRLACPVLRLDSAAPLETMAGRVADHVFA